MGDSTADLVGSPGRTVNSYYLNALFSINITTPAPTEDYVAFRHPETIHRIVEIVGILAAFAVSAIIIVGVAFMMSKLRKRSAVHEERGVSPAEVVMESGMAHADANLPHYDIKHVYSISGLTWTPKSKRSIKMVLVPNFLRRKNDIPAVHAALKKDLSRIYVY